MPILDAEGNDITTPLREGAGINGIPVQLPLACAIAESGLRPDAERWGRETTAAQGAIARQDWGALQAIINRAGSDVSFGLGQRVVPYHYYGDLSLTVSNCLAVRAYVFNHEAEDVWEMCNFLGDHYRKAGTADLSPTGGDRLLMALCAYNAGHVPTPSEAYWTTRAATVVRYREALQTAALRMEEINVTEPTYVAPEDVTFATRINELGPKLGSPLTDEMPITDCTIQAFENGVLVMIPGAGAYLWPEGTVADRFLPKA